MNIFQKKAKYIVILAVILGSLSGIFGKLITAPPMAIGFYRLTFALPFFALPILLRHRDILKKIHTKDILWSLLSGFFLFAHFFCWFTAVQTTRIASAIVLAALHPIVVLMVTVIFFKHKVKKKAFIGIVLAMLGGAIIAGFDYTLSSHNFFGDFMAILTAIFMGLYFSIGKAMRERIPAGTYVFLVFLSCWVFFIIGMFLTRTPFNGYPLEDFFWLILMALLCQIGAHAVLNWSFGYVSGLYVSAWETFEIVSATILAFIIFGEIPGPWQYVGGIIVVVGLLYYNRHEE